MQKLIVTGGLGFIGSNLIKLLLEKKYHVINVDKISYSSNFYNVKDFKKNKKYSFIKCDINNKKKFLNILKKNKPIGIFNLAAETHVDRSIDGPKAFINSNILGVFNLLEAFRSYSKKNKKIKLVHISTDEVFGDLKKGRSNEKFTYNPSSPYAASKAASDHLVSSYVKTYNLKAIVTNCSNNYGPRQHPEKLIPKLIYNIIKNKTLPIYGRGKNSREWIHVYDHCEALIKVLNDGIIGEKYNIGGRCEMSNLNLVKTIIDIMGKSESMIEFVEDRPGHDYRYSTDITKISNTLGWKPRFNFEEAIVKTIEWYRE